MEWGEDNHVQFHNTKDEVIAFTRRRKPELKKWIADSRITVCRHIMSFTTKAIRWL